MMRLSTRAKAIFGRVGWFEGRCIDITQKVGALEMEGWEINDFAREFLGNFDGLKIEQPILFVDLIEFDPLDLIGDFEPYGSWKAQMGVNFFPIGLKYAYRLFVDNEGIIYKDGYGTMYQLGQDFEEGMDELLFGGGNWKKLGKL